VSDADKQNDEKIILDVNNIEVIYDHVILVLKGVSLQVPEGGIVALLGANGAGKTTTLRAVSNLLQAERGEVTKGSITFEGKEIQARACAHVAAKDDITRRTFHGFSAAIGRRDLRYC